MLKIEDYIHKNTLTKQELLDNCVIAHTNLNDFMQVAKIMVDCFKIPSLLESIRYLISNNVDWENSIKLYHPDTNEIYGLLLFGVNKIQNSIPFIKEQKPLFCNMVHDINQIQGLAFILDKRVRGTGIDKKMLYYTDLKNQNQYEIVWCGVDKTLKTHDYWRRLGFIPVHQDFQVKFYIKML